MRPEMHDLSQPKKATFAQFDTELSTAFVDNSEQFLRAPLFQSFTYKASSISKLSTMSVDNLST